MGFFTGVIDALKREASSERSGRKKRKSASKAPKAKRPKKSKPKKKAKSKSKKKKAKGKGKKSKKKKPAETVKQLEERLYREAMALGKSGARPSKKKAA